MKNNKYMQFVKINDNNTELYVYGDIRKPDLIERWLDLDDPGRTDALSFSEALKQVDTPNLIVRINSYGGIVSEALAIYSLLCDSGLNVITKVDGFACSAASIIFMAGKERIVPESGLLMIHNAWSVAEGDSNALKKAAEDLEIITSPSLEIYASKTKLSKEQLKDMMDKETWINSNKAFEYGFATTLNKDDAAKQSIESNFVKKLVNKIEMLEKENLKLNKTIKENIKEKSADPWQDFFR
jgi:ATP-dependent Clp protease protease subunit